MNKRKQGSTTRFIKDFVLKFKMGLLWSLILGAIYGLVNTLSYWILGSFFTILFGGVQESPSPQTKMLESEKIQSINEYFKEILESLISSETFDETILKFGIIVFVIFALKNLFRYLSGWEMKKVIVNVVTKMRSVFMKHVIKQSSGFNDKMSSGKLFSYYSNDIQVVVTGLTSVSLDLIVNVFTFFSIIVMLFSISTKLSFFTIIVVPLTGFAIVSIASSIKRRSKRQLAKAGEVNQFFGEIINGFNVIKSFVREDEIIKTNDAKLDEYQKLYLREQKLSQLSSPLNEVLALVVGIGVFIYAGMWLLGPKLISPDDFFRFFTLVFALFQPLKVLGTAANKYNNLMAAVERVYEILDQEEKVKEVENTVKFSFENSIEFKNVNFSYPVSKDEIILNNLSLTINKGEKVAFVGPSGGGKSTITKVLLRLYDINSGSVTIDGVDIVNFDLSSLRKSISYVDQNIFLFDTTIKENILFGSNGKNLEIDEYLQESGSQFVYDLPEKEQTQVGEKGNLLSGGQKQRISIARAMIKDAPIMIFDEATSALDNKTEKLIQDVIFNRLKEKTVFIVAHRLSTIQNCDKIVLLKNGEIDAVGSHEELMQKSSLYKDLYTSSK